MVLSGHASERLTQRASVGVIQRNRQHVAVDVVGHRAIAKGARTTYIEWLTVELDVGIVRRVRDDQIAVISSIRCGRVVRLGALH